jgi:putative membrane protein
MATASVQRRVRAHPAATTAVVSAVGYVVVVGTLEGLAPVGLYPDLSLTTVNRLADAIAAVNATATAMLLYGFRAVRRGRIRRHRAAMLAAFGLILVFLVLYLLKVGGGGTKEFVGPDGAYLVYLGLLAVHVLLSMLSVPLVVYQVVTGLTHSTGELASRTRHRQVGRLAVAAWTVSLSLGVVSYLLLNHVYDWRFVAAALLVG